MQPENSKSKNSSAAPVGAGLVERLGLRFGVGVGVACAGWLLFLQLSHNNPFGPKQLLGQLFVPFAVIGSQWLLRWQLPPTRPGIGRALAVGGLTTGLAALITAASVWGLAHGVGEAGLAANRAERAEIIRSLQTIRPKEKRNAQFEARELRDDAAAATASGLAFDMFVKVLMLGTFIGVPSGLFLRK